MSAFMHDNTHIAALVNAGAFYGMPLDGGPEAVGQMLVHENYLSVCSRYADWVDTEDPEYRYRMETTEGTPNPVAVTQAVCSYEYQSCEHAGWDASAARAWCEKLIARVTERHPELAPETWSAQYREMVPAWRARWHQVDAWTIDDLAQLITPYTP